MRNSTVFFGLFALVVPSSLFLVTACGPSATMPEPGDELDLPGDSAECVAGESRCTSGYFQECSDGVFEDAEFCAKSCDASLGCVECKPSRGDFCVGDEVRSCTSGGLIGEVVEVCGPGQCNAGACDGSFDDCSDRAELVYVVDDEDNLYSFDPPKLHAGQDPFTLIGEMNCPASRSWSDWGGGRGTPFSMSVSRDATAWVLYTSGEIFHVSTENASCTETNFDRGQQGFDLFGMGFVSDSVGSSQEKLWIAGSTAWELRYTDTVGDLGYIDTDTMQVSRVGSLPSGGANSPELTGTGNGDLFGFYPGTSRRSSQVAHIDKGNARHGNDWSFTEPNDDVVGWAFAHWGGDFYIFVTTDEWIGVNSQVLHFDGDTGNVETMLSDLPYTIVGAGVSTCAPLVVD